MPERDCFSFVDRRGGTGYGIVLPNKEIITMEQCTDKQWLLFHPPVIPESATQIEQQSIPHSDVFLAINACRFVAMFASSV
jgi:hypothetical protein